MMKLNTRIVASTPVKCGIVQAAPCKVFTLYLSQTRSQWIRFTGHCLHHVWEEGATYGLLLEALSLLQAVKMYSAFLNVSVLIPQLRTLQNGRVAVFCYPAYSLTSLSAGGRQ
eukprot:TRINITY_DN16221_c0_g1_i1.p2 TRINITY_DN16221_c0_g1~~TRINITY_DN16221_c0_g1_i1.p2  ORF type:complete len:113 (+),score=0.54 TRINITY_DN16221_c0_g1_i1:638-976(+)